MGYLKFSEEEFLEKQELNRLMKFLVDDGYRFNMLQDTYSFGLIKSKSDPSFNNFKVEAGTNAGTIKIANASYAIDKDGLVIYKESQDNIALTNDNQYYWVRIEHAYTPKEIGTVSIDAAGNLTGTGTEFTKVLRGIPNYPAVIKFYGSALNTLEYQVVSVVNDTNATLSGVLQPETGLKYSVIGTFTPGVVPIAGSKEIFQYDSCDLQFIVEASTNVAPAITGSNIDRRFYIARVKRNGSAIVIEDKRNNFWLSKADVEQLTFTKTANPLVGVEQIRWDSTYATKDKNRVQLGWGFRSTNWTIDTATRKLTVNGGSGGKFKTTSDFTNGNFDGWKVYRKDGGFDTIISSSKTGSQINLILDTLDPDDYPNTVPEVKIVPPVEEIQFQFNYDAAATTNPINNQGPFTFSINAGVSEAFVTVPSTIDVYKFNILYRYKKFNEYSAWDKLPNDAVGFYDETSFDIHGVLGTPNQKPYTGHLTNGYIETIPATDSYYNVISDINLGDKLGVTHVDLDPTAPLIHLTVGTDRQHEIFEGTHTLIADMFVNLKSVKSSGADCSNGNTFFLHFTSIVTPSTFKLRIVENYVNTTTYDLLHEFTQDDFDFCTNSEAGLIYKVIFDGADWIIVSVNEVEVEANWKPLVTNVRDSSTSGGPVTVTIDRSKYKVIGKTLFLDLYYSIVIPTAFANMFVLLPAALTLKTIQRTQLCSMHLTGMNQISLMQIITGSTLSSPNTNPNDTLFLQTLGNMTYVTAISGTFVGETLTVRAMLTFELN